MRNRINSSQLRKYILLTSASLGSLCLPVSLSASSQEEDLQEVKSSSVKQETNNLYERWAPLQGILNTQSLLFRKQEIEGDSALGFCAFNLDREQGIQCLVKAKEDEKARQLAQQEIFQAFLEGTFPKSMQKTAYKSLRRDYFAARKKLESLVKDLNEDHKTEGKDAQYFTTTLKDEDEEKKILSVALSKLEKKNQKSLDYCSSSKVFEEYVTAYLKEEGQELKYLKGQRGLIDALAYLTETRLFIWQRKDSESKDLNLVHQFKGDSPKETVHLLHEEGKKTYALLSEMGEKDLLFELSRKVESLEDVKVKLERSFKIIEAQKKFLQNVNKSKKEQKETFSKKFEEFQEKTLKEQKVLAEKLEKQEETFSKKLAELQEKFADLDKKYTTLAQKKST